MTGDKISWSTVSTGEAGVGLAFCVIEKKLV